MDPLEDDPVAAVHGHHLEPLGDGQPGGVGSLQDTGLEVRDPVPIRSVELEDAIAVEGADLGSAADSQKIH